MSYLKSKPGSIEELVKGMTKHANENAYQDMFKKELEKTGKGIASMSPKEKKDFFNKIDDKYKAKNEKVDNPYAVGMAAAMKAKDDKPPLKKSTITKAHDIAKSITKDDKKEEVIGEKYTVVITKKDGTTMELGRYNTPAEAQKFVDMYGKGAKVKKEELSEATSHTVRFTDPLNKKRFAVPFKTHKAAEEKMAQLKRDGVKDIKITMDVLKPGIKFAEQVEDLNESHFEVGQKVKCISSGMTGEVIKVDPEEKGKYYTVKRNDGEEMKYAPDELKAVVKEDKAADMERARNMRDQIADLQTKSNKIDKSNPAGQEKDQIVRADMTSKKLKLQDLMKKISQDEPKEKKEESSPKLYNSFKKEQDVKDKNRTKTMTDKPMNPVDTQPKLDTFK